MDENIEDEAYPLFDALDAAILMHRDAHFGGKFDFMIDYYKREGKGVQEDFNLERILFLSDAERQLGQNLAAVLLSGADAERVAQSRDIYKKLRALYENKNPKQKIPTLIANLILSEEDEEEAIQAIVDLGSTVVPELIELLRSEDFHDSIFPGYGLAPGLAVRTLGQIGDKRAIIALFEEIGKEDFFGDEFILKALKAIGEPAKAFLMRVLAKQPLNEDNERAAMSLIAFKDDPGVAEEALKMLQDPIVKRDTVLSTYLILIAEGLTDPLQRELFKSLAKNPDTPKDLLLDIQAILKSWEA